MNTLSIGIVRFENFQPSIFAGRRQWCKLSRDHGGFPEMTPRQKMFFDLSIVDIQSENKGYSICQIVQNNDLPIRVLYRYQNSLKRVPKKSSLLWFFNKSNTSPYGPLVISMVSTCLLFKTSKFQKYLWKSVFVIKKH